MKASSVTKNPEIAAGSHSEGRSGRHSMQKIPTEWYEWCTWLGTNWQTHITWINLVKHRATNHGKSAMSPRWKKETWWFLVSKTVQPSLALFRTTSWVEELTGVHGVSWTTWGYMGSLPMWLIFHDLSNGLVMMNGFMADYHQTNDSGRFSVATDGCHFEAKLMVDEWCWWINPWWRFINRDHQRSW